MYIVIEIETIIAGSKSIAFRSEGVNIKPGEGEGGGVLKQNLKERERVLRHN